MNPLSSIRGLMSVILIVGFEVAVLAYTDRLSSPSSINACLVGIAQFNFLAAGGFDVVDRGTAKSGRSPIRLCI